MSEKGGNTPTKKAESEEVAGEGFGGLRHETAALVD